MTSYLVKWEANVSAETPRAAAKMALALLRSGAPADRIFKVVLSGGQSVTINLDKVE